ncbi:GFA family protein [Pyxidicoccus fallax]|uniref:GFA family protein n=1 Tax=Pyxidicoccus fallax TaxID=394095 RepID=A0A848L5Y9_9BACT|nr:GFA family protein [Pyxidicoccus fallax]NMO14026.1 GFA family protein [Pyxidicoccus fallax]NPC76642.1 GFA family protein [Pyxidicoccus fallax]
MKKTYRGSCHCGAVRFETDIDLSEGTWKCNCTICTKARLWHSVVKPEEFRLLAGESELSEYQFHTRALHHLFCKHCGVHVFGWGEAPEIGRFYTPKLNCLDDVDLNALVHAPVFFVDGRNDNFKAPPAEVRHL